MTQTLNNIGYVESPYKEKFAIPRQPGLVPEAHGTIHLLDPYCHADTVRGLEAFSHIWILFQFHGIQEGKWSALVRPPRLGGNKKVGVFASRSTHRPNGIGMSVVKLEAIDTANNMVKLHISGMDLLDGTPVLDIKPYVPYSDSIPEATDGFAPVPTALLSVTFAESVLDKIKRLETRYSQLKPLITSVLAQDPKPAYKNTDELREFGMRLLEFNIVWQQKGQNAHVIKIEDLRDPI